MRSRPRLAMLVAAVAVAGCMPAARLFLDLPEQRARQRSGEGEGATLTIETLDSLLAELAEPAERTPLPIELLTEPDSVLAYLPEDRAGNVDWVQAWREGVIEPRLVSPRLADESTDQQGFAFDIYLRSGSGPEAYLPHSVHQQWMTCQSCHPGVYRRGRATGVSAEVIHGETSCGFCHGPVAFPMDTCERCHSDASGLPAGRSNKRLGGEMTMARAQADDDAMAASDLYEPAVFPHGEHRLRFQCRACHEAPFPMRSGATVMGREQAHSFEGCGVCHDGTTAFATELDQCYRCHLEGGL